MKKLFLSLALFLVCSVAHGASLLVSWDDNSSAESGYAIERADSTGVFKEVGRVAANVIVYNDSALPELATFTYRVRAFKTVTGQPDIVSAYSNTASGTTTLNGPTNNKVGPSQIVKLGRGESAYIIASK